MTGRIRYGWLRKKGLLKSMGVDMTDKNLSMRLEGFLEQHNLYQYGVHVENEHWENTVSSVLKDTRDMMAMDVAREKFFGLINKPAPK